MKHRRILFICKKPTGYGIPAGLFNSAQFVVNALREIGHEARFDFAIDANCIDRLVSNYDPTHVVLEAIWCPPAKLDELVKIWRHADRIWVIRIHSKTPFLSQEGVAIEWIRRYQEIALDHPGSVVIAPNSKSFETDLDDAMNIKSMLLPNIYAPCRHKLPPKPPRRDFVLNIGCFGAVRPLKNQLEQAMGALALCKNKSVMLKFHINGGRVEDRGESALKSLRALFAGSWHQLVEHKWLDHSDFLELVRTMDLGMQVSFSESFNIVAADFVHAGVPIVVSPDVEWMPRFFKCSPNSSKSMASALWRAWVGRSIGLQRLSTLALNRHNRGALKKWKAFLENSK